MDNHQSATVPVGAEYQRLLRLKQVQDRTGLGRSKLYLLIQQGDFPPPLKLGSRCSMWVESDVAGWIARLIDQQKSKGVAA